MKTCTNLWKQPPHEPFEVLLCSCPQARSKCMYAYMYVGGDRRGGGEVRTYQNQGKYERDSESSFYVYPVAACIAPPELARR